MRIAVIGTGYVGLVSGAGLAQTGHQVACVDTDARRLDLVGRGIPPFHEPGLAALLAGVIRSGRLRVEPRLDEAVRGADATIIAVGTPIRDGAMDSSYVAAAAQAIGQALRGASRDHLVVVKSTVVPGTTDTLVRGILERESGRPAGSFGLCMNPEFLREGSAVEDFLHPDRIVIGAFDTRSGERLAEVYDPFDCPKVFTTLRDAEMIKYASNALLATLISFSNELAALCEATPGTDVEQVLEALHLDRRLSPVMGGARVSPGILSYLRAGCGFGGSCLPKDLSALRQYARERHVPTGVLDGVSAVNARRPAVLADMAERALQSLSGATVAVLGLAFKPGTSDLRDAPALAVVDLLRQRGACVRAYDPCVRSLPEDGHAGVTVCASPGLALAGCDAALIVTAWPELADWDWHALCGQMRRPIVIDGRNALRAAALPEGATYLRIGRHYEFH